MKTLGEQGMYPSFFHFTGGHGLHMGVGIGVSAGGKRWVVIRLWRLMDPMVEEKLVRTGVTSWVNVMDRCC
jgi:heme/copper-type cytochrome/quinol oxidase subunit 3